MTRTLRISATLFAALLLTTGTQVASASQRLAAGTLVPNVAPTATLTVSPTQWSFRETFDGESTYLPADATTGVDVATRRPR